MPPRRNRTDPDAAISDYRHDEARRKNNPPAGIAGRGTVEKLKRQVYSYDAHLPPALRFDPTGSADALPPLLREARTRVLSEAEVRELAEALRRHEPWLEWSGKREKRTVEVDPVALHVHERVSTQALLRLAARETVQRSLFADPVLPYHQAVQFYQHEVGWANRLILGDSLAVMASLAVRENLAGKVQMIYIDPPYGIRFASNFQPVVGQRDVKDKESDLTREPEVVKAFRDTWELGVHTYLAYLRDRLVVARSLLTEQGSVFVQIGDENLHRVRAVMDEVFGSDNFIAIITVKKTAGLSKGLMPEVADFLLWYARDKERVKRRTLFLPKVFEEDAAYRLVQTEAGEHRRVNGDQVAGVGGRANLLRYQILLAAGRTPSCVYTVEAFGGRFDPTAGRSWATNPDGMRRLLLAERVVQAGSTLSYVRFGRDNPVNLLQNLWADTASGSGMEKVYVVQTSTKVVERCILMTTDPGDLVLDPTCGSGTTAYVAEQWGRRWITIDSSRVALFIARQRLLTATYPYYKLRDDKRGVAGSFEYRTVPHITLKSIAQNRALDPIFEKHAPVLAERLAALNTALKSVTPELRGKLEAKLAAKKKRKDPDDPVTDADERRWVLPKTAWQEWEVPFDTDPDWPSALRAALEAYRAGWRAKMDEVNACIERNAEPVDLVDDPDVVPRVLRVSGPFTVEGVEPMAESLDEPSPIEEPEGTLPTMAGESAAPRYNAEPSNADAYLEKMLRLLRADGVRFMNNKQARIERLDRRTGGVLHADGEWASGDAEPRRLAVVIGPQYGPVTAKLVEQAVRAAVRAGFDDLVVAGFAFDAEASALIEADPDPDIRTHLAHIRPDVQMEDLLKDSPNSQIFTVFGSPRTRIEPAGDGEYVVHMEGMDVYDPVSSALFPTGADKVAAWFVDSDYDGRTFCISQAFFPDRSAWDKVARALGVAPSMVARRLKEAAASPAAA